MCIAVLVEGSNGRAHCGEDSQASWASGWQELIKTQHRVSVAPSVHFCCCGNFGVHVRSAANSPRKIPRQMYLPARLTGKSQKDLLLLSIGFPFILRGQCNATSSGKRLPASLSSAHTEHLVQLTRNHTAFYLENFLHYTGSSLWARTTKAQARQDLVGFSMLAAITLDGEPVCEGVVLFIWVSSGALFLAWVLMPS